MTVSEDPQGYALLSKRHISAHMCTIENGEDLCKGMLEASSVVLVPAKKSWGRGERVTTSAGEHRKKWPCHTPLALGSGAAPMVSTEPSPAARRCLRPACQHNSGAWKKPPLAVVTRPCGAGLRPPACRPHPGRARRRRGAPDPPCAAVRHGVQPGA